MARCEGGCEGELIPCLTIDSTISSVFLREKKMTTKPRQVAALYVDVDKGPYANLPDVEAWGIEQDATTYDGPDPIVAHPACAPWGKFSWRSCGADSKVDGSRSCGLIAVDQVRRFGGVVEHPVGSKLWEAMGMPRPGEGKDSFGGWTLDVKQVDWGHPCEKRTWLYIVGVEPEDIPRIPPSRQPTHVIESGGGATLPRLPKSQRHITPPKFAKWLVDLARRVDPTLLKNSCAGVNVERRNNPVDGPRDEACFRARFVDDNPQFALAMADVLRGTSTLVGQAWLEDGREIIEVESKGYCANPVDDGEEFSGSIEIGDRFLTRPLKDYEDWKKAWWREALQNSIDAGATEISLGASKNEDGTWTVFCDDNGKGMNFEQVRSYFLRMGETGKPIGSGSGNVGGFGKAKELLVLPWIQWTVEIDGTKIVGHGLPFKKMAGQPRQGVRIEVIMPADTFTTISQAKSILERSRLDTKILLNGEQFNPESFLNVTEMLRTIEGKGDLYIKRTPGEKHSTILVRHHGLFMFEIYTSLVEGVVVLELTGPSIELLASNRDSFADYYIKSAISDFVTELAKDPSSSLVPQGKKLRKLYRGEGEFKVKQQEELASVVLDKKPVFFTSSTQSEEAVEELIFVLEVAKSNAETTSEFRDTQKDFLNALQTTSETSREIITHAPTAGFEDKLRLVKALVWKPDFLVLNENADKDVPKIFLPEHMTATTLRLARVWAEVCKFVLLQIRNFEPFGIGFCFDPYSQAMFTEDDGSNWFLLNPFKNPKVEAEGILRPTDDKDLAKIYACAIHECSHLMGYSYHDESFATRMTENMALCAPGWRHVKKLALSVPMKGQISKK